jgi:hypothetical protein
MRIVKLSQLDEVRINGIRSYVRLDNIETPCIVIMDDSTVAQICVGTVNLFTMRGHRLKRQRTFKEWAIVVVP